jgi:hypothetical protein
MPTGRVAQGRWIPYITVRSKFLPPSVLLQAPSSSFFLFSHPKSLISSSGPSALTISSLFCLASSPFPPPLFSSILPYLSSVPLSPALASQCQKIKTRYFLCFVSKPKPIKCSFHLRSRKSDNSSISKEHNTLICTLCGVPWVLVQSAPVQQVGYILKG